MKEKLENSQFIVNTEEINIRIAKKIPPQKIIYLEFLFFAHILEITAIIGGIVVKKTSMTLPPKARHGFLQPWANAEWFDLFGQPRAV